MYGHLDWAEVDEIVEEISSKKYQEKFQKRRKAAIKYSKFKIGDIVKVDNMCLEKAFRVGKVIDIDGNGVQVEFKKIEYETGYLNEQDLVLYNE